MTNSASMMRFNDGNLSAVLKHMDAFKGYIWKHRMGMENGMEQANKQYTEEFLAIMQHTHVTIKRLLEAGNYPSALKQLEQCQGYAIALGQRLEASEGASSNSNSMTVALLEEYCEVVYQIYEKVRLCLPFDANDIHNCLAMQLIRIGNGVKDSE